MRRRLLPWLAGVLLLFGCATTGTDQVNVGRKTLAGSTKVVFSKDQITYEQVNLGESVGFWFDEQTTVLQTGEDRCFAKGFAIPSGHSPYSVSVTSFRGGTRDDPWLMYPEVKVLDKDYRVMYTVPAKDFAFRPSQSREGLKTVLFVNNKSDESERFLLVTNRTLEEADMVVAQDIITDTMPITVPVPGGFIMWMVPTGKNMPPVRMKATATGQMEVLFQEYKPKKVGK